MAMMLCKRHSLVGPPLLARVVRDPDPVLDDARCPQRRQLPDGRYARRLCGARLALARLVALPFATAHFTPPGNSPRVWGVSEALTTHWRGTWIVGALACSVAVCHCKRTPAPANEQEPTAQVWTDSNARPSAPPPMPQGAPDDAGLKGWFAVELGEVRLDLQGCVLTFSSPNSQGRFDVGFPGTCAFADNANGAVQIITTARGQVVLVEASRPVPPSYPGEHRCDTRLRGVLVSGNSVSVSRDTQQVAGCASGPWDDVMFHVFALHTVPIGGLSADGG
jgi:hypothetical protein